MFVQVSQSVLHTFRQSSHQVYDGRIGRDICEETKHYWLVLTLSVLGRSLDARTVHPANKHSGSVKETNATLNQISRCIACTKASCCADDSWAKCNLGQVKSVRRFRQCDVGGSKEVCRGIASSFNETFSFTPLLSSNILGKYSFNTLVWW